MPAGRLLYRNHQARALLSPAPRDRLGHDTLRLVPVEHRRRVMREWRATMAHGVNRSFECPLRVHGGRVRWLFLHLAPLHGEKGGESGWIGLAFDIDAIKVREADLQEALRQEEEKRRASHHHNQNSLQIVSGLLTLQAHRLSDPAARAALLETRDQISTIAQLHRAVRGGDDDRVEIVAFLHALLERLTGPHKVDATIEAPSSLFLSVERALPVALVIEAMVRDVLRAASAFRLSIVLHPDEIWIELAREDGGPVADDEEDGATSLGMDIAPSLAEQAGGRLEQGGSATGAYRRLVLRR